MVWFPVRPLLAQTLSAIFLPVLREAKQECLKEITAQAQAMGANAIIGIDLDYETVGGSMLMVTAAGTAVRYI